MKTRSAKAKGRRLQQHVRTVLLEKNPELEEDDIKVAIMGESGEDIKFSPAARKQIPYSIECKNVEKLNIWAALEQAEENANEHMPVLVFRRNHSKTYAVVEFEHFVELVKKYQSSIVSINESQ